MSNLTQRVSDKATIEAIQAQIKELSDDGLNVSAALKMPDDGPAIYAGFYGCYASGSLYGSWINLNEAKTADHINGLIDLLRLAASDEHKIQNNLEEVMIQDSQGLPDSLRSESLDFAELESYLESIDEISEDEKPAYDFYCSNFSEAQNADDFREAFCGYYESEEDYAQQLWEDCATTEEREAARRWPLNCIDWEHAARELRYGGDIYSSNYIIGHGYAIFRNI